MGIATIKGKEKIEKYFKGQKLPFWKIKREDDSRISVGSNLIEKNISNSLRMFIDLIDTVDPSHNYILEMYPELPKRDGQQQTFTTPASYTTFTLDGITPISGITTDSPPRERSELKGNLGVESYMMLVGENARLTAKSAFDDQRIKQFEIEIKELKDEVEHLNSIVDDYEEEEQEEMAAEAMAGTEKEESLASVATSLLKTHGPALVTALTKGSKKIDPNNYTPPIEMDEDPAHITGISDNLPDINIIVKQLQGIDPKFNEHLFKLLLIAQQQPEMFKSLITTLENL